MPRGEDQTTIALLAHEKGALEEAKRYYEEKQGRHLSTGEFVKLLAEEYLGREGRRNPVVAQQAQPVNAMAVPPGQTAYLLKCPLCGGAISWPIGLRSGACPYCKRFLTYG
ncbi:hypothetical protein ACFLXC_01545 [Chloroflexota bacterium]